MNEGYLRKELLKKESLRYWKELHLSAKIIIIAAIIVSVSSILISIILKFIYVIGDSGISSISSLVTIFFALGIILAIVSLIVGMLRNAGLR